MKIMLTHQRLLYSLIFLFLVSFNSYSKCYTVINKYSTRDNKNTSWWVIKLQNTVDKSIITITTKDFWEARDYTVGNKKCF